MHRLAILDDNESWSFVAALRLRQHGFEVSTFTDPHTFLRQAEQFDLALVDFSLPPRRYEIEIDGPNVISRVKQRLVNPPLLILISSYFTEDILQQGADISPEADAVLSKQIDSSSLIEQIEQLLATKNSPAVQNYHHSQTSQGKA
ncbi:response regulator [Pantanalinema sp. GBBB05]|uniref:response regulator n=1 Tax=Pantanalinema sp. GBBB05 TaxID=2604139 RepID=UPI001D7FA5B3|nr:response regulator [Pantanalinema sp. GBBB05]